MEYRTRSIDDGIVAKWDVGDGRTSGVVLDYQPGNGTRYRLGFLWLPSGEAERHFGAVGGGCIVSWVDHCAIIVPTHKNAFLDWTYIAEKFKVNKADGVVLAEIIGHIVGVRATTSEQARHADALSEAN